MKKIQILLNSINSIIEIATTGHGAERRWWQQDYRSGVWVPLQATGIPGAHADSMSYSMKIMDVSKEDEAEWNAKFTALRIKFAQNDFLGDDPTDAYKSMPPVIANKYRDGSGGTFEMPTSSLEEALGYLATKNDWLFIG